MSYLTKKEEQIIKYFAEQLAIADIKFVIIITHSLIDDLLTNILIEFLPQCKTGRGIEFDKRELTFLMKSKLLHGLNLIDKHFFEALIILNKMRNKIAHDIMAHIRSHEIRKYSDELIKLFRDKSVIDDISMTYFRGYNSESANFRSALLRIVFLLYAFKFNIEKATVPNTILTLI